MDFPRFDGTSPRAWIVKCNTYFKTGQNILKDQKDPFASMYLEGRATQWYNSFSAQEHEVTWSQFVEILSARFEELKEAQIVDDFNKLRLTGNYMEFVEKSKDLRDCMKMIYGDMLAEDYYMHFQFY